MRWPSLHCPVAAGLLVLLAGCGKPADESQESYAPTIDPAHFVARVDNEFFPLIPGTRYVYATLDGNERVDVYVTEQTKEILGVTCTVVRSREFENGELAEETADWYAQDVDGNVWYFGEDTKEYKGGAVVSVAGSWQAGRGGAQPGIIMRGAPRVGDSYRQEYLAGVAEDMGEVLSLEESATVPYGSFANVLKTKEWTPLEPGDVEHGYYARGVGLILEVEGDERLELVSVEEDEMN